MKKLFKRTSVLERSQNLLSKFEDLKFELTEESTMLNEEHIALQEIKMSIEHEQDQIQKQIEKNIKVANNIGKILNEEI